ncbi:MAG TPA: hypothetical protein VK009_27310, partial [Chloroflexota bacterium]|nr:hypothetical protein [Chloroflexota bacterium]
TSGLGATSSLGAANTRCRSVHAVCSTPASRHRSLTADEEEELNETLAVENFMRWLKVAALTKRTA